jgi:hypothetical protein
MKQQRNIRKIYKKILKYKIGILFCMIFLFIGIEILTYYVDIHKSMTMQLIKKYYLQNVLNQTKHFYTMYDRPLETDEWVLLHWLWPQKFKKNQHIFVQDPFYKMNDKMMGVNDLDIVRHVDSSEDMVGFIRLFGENTSIYEVNQKYKNNLLDPTDDVLVKALYCENGYDEFDFEFLKKARDNIGGYGDTHYLMSLLLLKSMNCVDNDIIQRELNNVVNTIIKAQIQDQEFSDLFAERIVVLYWAGKRHSIKYDWIKQIVQNQQNDGGWSDIDNYNTNPHTTGLAGLAIIYFINNGIGNEIWFAK